MNLSTIIKKNVREIPDFPREGILFRDITTVLADPELTLAISHTFRDYWLNKGIEGVAAIESRGFIFGMQLAQQLQVPFIPVRKAGKLPYRTIKHSYQLEYGSAEVEIHEDAISEGQNILIHDDLLATGGTAGAASELIKKSGGSVGGYSFIIELGFLEGREAISHYHKDIHSLAIY